MIRSVVFFASMLGHYTIRAADKCEYLTWAWYGTMVFGAYKTSGVINTSSELNNLLDEISVGKPVISGRLKNHLIGAGDTCAVDCILPFVNSVFDLKSRIGSVCGYSTTWDANSESNLKKSCSLVLFYDAIDIFNACASETSGYDVLTIQFSENPSQPISQRCSRDEFVAFELKHHPWVSMINKKAKGFLVDFYASSISASFNTDSTSLKCASCFNTLYSALPGGGGPCKSTPFSVACRDSLSVPLEAFAVCTGGHYINTYACTAGEDDVLDAQLLPYEAYVSCAANDSVVNIEACVSTFLDQPFTVGFNCGQCYPNFERAIFTLNPGSECDNVWAPSCIDLFTDSPAGGPLGSLMEEFEICTGYAMDVSQIAECTLSEWETALSYEERSMVPLYVAAKYDANDSAVGEAIVGLPCDVCFSRFAQRINALYAGYRAAVEAACGDPYTPKCRTLLAVPLAAFAKCSSHALNWSATSTICTGDEFDEIVLTSQDAIIAAGYANISEPELISLLDQIRGSQSQPCWPCFTELAHAIYSLDWFERSQCEADLWGDTCAQEVLLEYYNGFQDCTGGFPFASISVSSTSTTTNPITSTTTPSTSASTSSVDSTTSTSVSTAAPSTKGHTLLTASILFIVYAL